jgi:hypothetical protein
VYIATGARYAAISRSNPGTCSLGALSLRDGSTSAGPTGGPEGRTDRNRPIPNLRTVQRPAQRRDRRGPTCARHRKGAMERRAARAIVRGGPPSPAVCCPSQLLTATSVSSTLATAPSVQPQRSAIPAQRLPLSGRQARRRDRPRTVHHGQLADRHRLSARPWVALGRGRAATSLDERHEAVLDGLHDRSQSAARP